MQSLHPMRSNESPTAPIAPTAPAPLLEPLEPPTDVPPFQPLEPFEPTAPIWPVAPAHLVQPVGSVQLVQPQQPATSAQPVPRSPGVSLAERAEQITYLVLGLVEALIITRVILKLLAANPEAGFVRFIYARSALFVAPFQGIFPAPATQSSVLELSSLVAIAVYALIAWGLVRLIAIFRRRQALS
jgi:YGGT family protein